MIDRPFTVSVLMLVVLATLTPLPVTAQTGQFTATHSSDTVYSGGTYSVTAEDGREPARNDTESPEFVAIVSRDNRNQGLETADHADVESEGSGSFDFDVPEDPRHGRYRAIVISSGFDGQFGRGSSAADIEDLVASNPGWSYEQLEDAVRGRTVEEGGSDDAIEVLRFTVSAHRPQRLVFHPVRRRVALGEELTVSGEVIGNASESIRVEVRSRFNEEQLVYSERMSVESDSRWEQTVDTSGLLLGWYEVRIEPSDGLSKRWTFRVLPDEVTGDARSTERLFTPESLRNDTREDRLPYERTLVADLDSIGVGEQRAVVASVDAVGSQNELRSFLVADGSRSAVEIPLEATQPARAKVVTREDVDPEIGDWLLLYVTRIEDESTATGNGTVIGTFQASSVVQLDRSFDGMRISRDEVRDFMGTKVVFDTEVRYIRERLLEPDEVYLEGGSGTVHTVPRRSDSFEVGDEVTVSGRLTTTWVDETAATSFSPVTFDEAGSSFAVASIAAPRITPRSGNASRNESFELPVGVRELTGYDFVDVADVNQTRTRRIAFNATVDRVARTRGTETATARALVVGESGGEAVVRYSSDIDLAANYSILVRGVRSVKVTDAGVPEIVPAGIGIYDYGRPTTENTTNTTTEPTTNETNATAPAGTEIVPVSLDAPETEVRTVPFWINLTSENVGSPGTGSHSVVLPENTTVLAAQSGKKVTTETDGAKPVVRANGSWQAGGRDTLAIRVRIDEKGLYGVEYGSEANRSATVVNVTDPPTPPSSIVILDSAYEFRTGTRYAGQRYFVYQYTNTNPLGNRLEVTNASGVRVSNGTLARAVVNKTGGAGGWSGLNMTRFKVLSPGGLLVGVALVGLRLR